MRFAAAVTALLAFALSGCGVHVHRPEGKADRGIDPRSPVLAIKGGVITVSPEPLVFTRDEKKVDIVWNLPPGHVFADKGIEVVAVRPLPGKTDLVPGAERRAIADIDCYGKGGGRVFVCRNQGEVRGVVFKYVIRVLVDGKEPVERDPEIWNLN